MGKKQRIARKHLRKACHHATGMSKSEMLHNQEEYLNRFVRAGLAIIAARTAPKPEGERGE